MSNLNLVVTSLTIAGKPCHFVHISLDQAFNMHHKFEIKLDYQELDTIWMNNPIPIIKLIGEDVGITMTHRQTGETNLFMGIITNVSMNGSHGEENFINISGCSPTIKLDGSPTLDSFTDLTLQKIVQESIDNSGNGGEVSIKPAFKSTIDYLTQYNESCFEFLNRLSYLYGEYFYFNGTSCYFGKPDDDDVAVITYDQEMSHFDFNATLIPPKVKRYEYLNHDDNEANSETPDTVQGVRGYLKVALDKSKKTYTSDAIRPLNASIRSKKDLDDMVKVDKYRMISQMMGMKGTTQTCKVKIGKLITVKLPSTMRVPLKEVETFLVTHVVHDIDQDGTYKNTFSAIPSEMENVPMNPINSPYAFPQIAWVKTNADKKGRVKVQFQWQKAIAKTTNWIRVQTPDAGSSDKVANNRGFVFVPEEGDLVMINFEGGDPNRPFVTGSIFAENIGTGGGNTNKAKSLTTRSGSTVTLNDEDGSVLIKDKSGSESKITLDGEKNIKVEADKSVDVNVGKGKAVLNMTDEGEITITAKKQIKLKVGNSTFVLQETNIQQKSNANKIEGTNHVTGGDTMIDGGNCIIN